LPATLAFTVAVDGRDNVDASRGGDYAEMEERGIEGVKINWEASVRTLRTKGGRGGRERRRGDERGYLTEYLRAVTHSAAEDRAAW
jgi:hypothetical protein